MTTKPAIISLQAAALPPASEGGVPEWIQLVPGGPRISTLDRRGPYRLTDPAAVIAASPERLPIDENHAIDIAAPRGEPSPARGYVVELQAREDGIWGRVDWTSAGRALVADRAYLGISAAIIHDDAGRILSIQRASLTNRPNLRGMVALHSQENRMFQQEVARALDLAEDADEESILAALTALVGRQNEQTALQAQMAEVAEALGVPADARREAILAAARATGNPAAAGATAALPAEMLALQTELARSVERVNALEAAGARTQAETVVDTAIREGRAGVKPLRQRYIALHMADPEATAEMLAALPRITGAGDVLPPSPPSRRAGEAGQELALQSAQRDVARMLGIDPKDYARTLEAERLDEETA